MRKASPKISHHIVGQTAFMIIGITEYAGHNTLLIGQTFLGGLSIPFAGSHLQFICPLYIAA